MRKLTRKSLDELAKIYPVLSDEEQRGYVAGTSPTGSITGTATVCALDGCDMYHSTGEHFIPPVIGGSGANTGSTTSPPTSYYDSSFKSVGDITCDTMYDAGYNEGFKNGLNGSYVGQFIDHVTGVIVADGHVSGSYYSLGLMKGFDDGKRTREARGL